MKFISLLSLLFLIGCSGTIPVMRGAENLDKGEEKFIFTGNVNISNLEIKTSGDMSWISKVSQDQLSITPVIGLNWEYGVSKTTNLGFGFFATGWEVSSILTSHFQLVQSRIFIPTIGVDCAFQASANDEYSGFNILPSSSFTLGLRNRFFVGVRYTNRIQFNKNIVIDNHVTEKNVSHNIFDLFFGKSIIHKTQDTYGSESKTFTPSMAFTFNENLNWWQFYMGLSISRDRKYRMRYRL